MFSFHVVNNVLASLVAICPDSDQKMAKLILNCHFYAKTLEFNGLIPWHPKFFSWPPFRLSSMTIFLRHSLEIFLIKKYSSQCKRLHVHISTMCMFASFFHLLGMCMQTKCYQWCVTGGLLTIELHTPESWLYQWCNHQATGKRLHIKFAKVSGKRPESHQHLFILFTDKFLQKPTLPTLNLWTSYNIKVIKYIF